MPNQVEFDRVSRCVIEPIKRHWNAEFDPDTISDFVDDLARYPEPVLKKAIEHARQTNKRRPTLAHIVEACEKVKSPPERGSNPSVKQPWDERDEKRNQLVIDYVSNYIAVSQLWFEAKREGWDADLMRYITAVAWVQAQMIIPGGRGIGWSGNIIFSHTPKDQEIRQFMDDQKRQAETGVVSVAIPTGKITEWKEAAAWRIKQSQPKSPPPAAPKETTRIDREIERQLTKEIA